LNEPTIFVLNAGSSSLKFSLFAGERALCHGQVDRIEGGDGSERPRLAARDAQGKSLADQTIDARSHEAALDAIMSWVRAAFPGQTFAAVGHRVVHGGDLYTTPVRVTTEVVARLRELYPLAPLHQPHNVHPIEILLRREPALLQVACFDTAFHATQEKLERMFALPRAYFERGVKRYGFHGLSYEYIASALSAVDARAARGRTIVCHLGNGASLCALAAGKSVATTMSFTALDGVPMGTRSGALDPGVLLYLLQHERMDAGAISDLLYRHSGLLGVSGLSADMRDLLASDAPPAREAVELYCRRIAREVGSLAAALGGLDALVFTAGIGEHAAPVRARVADLCRWLGVRIDPAKNERHASTLHTSDSTVAVLVVPTNEELMIARHTAHTLTSR
jgi:acetate kinase